MKPFCKEDNSVVDVARKSGEYSRYGQILKGRTSHSETAVLLVDHAEGDRGLPGTLRLRDRKKNCLQVRRSIYQPGVPRIHGPDA